MGSRRVVESTITQCLNHGFERGQGSAQFVRDVADKVPADRLQATDGGQILNDDQCPLLPWTQRRDDNL